jgi:hypothetical protein
VLTSVAVLVVAARERSARLLPYAALSLGLGLLTHYSAAPWILALAAAGAWVGRRHWRERSVWTRGALSAAVFGVVVAPWFAWAAVQFGVHGTAVANSTTAAWAEETPVQRIAVALANLADTIVPFPLRRDVSLSLIDQPSPLGRLRDVAFNGYQLNLLLACGLAGLFVLTGSAVGARGRIPRTTAARFLGIAMPLAIVLGIWVHTPRDTWGLMHICLQPAAVLGLAAVAAQLADHRRLRLGWALFAFVDLTLGIGLHFALEHWPVPTGSTPAAVAANEVLNRAAAANACDKLAFHFRFLADVLSVPSTLIWTWLVVLLFTAVAWLRVGSFGFFSRGHRR